MDRRVQVAYNNHIKSLPQELQEREAALIEVGRQHARNFDAGHFPSGNAVQRVLAELRRMTVRFGREQIKPAPAQKSDLDKLRDKRAQRLSGAS